MMDPWESEDFRTSDPYLIDHAESAFGFLESEFHYAQIAKSMHFRGHYLMYQGSAMRVAIEFDPETTRTNVTLYPAADLIPGGHARSITAEGILSDRVPGGSWAIASHSPPFSRVELAEAFDTWARGLRDHAAGILDGTDPGSDLHWDQAW